MSEPKFAIKPARITEVTQENARVKTFHLSVPLKAQPGQFVMLWIPGVNEKPMSFSHADEKGIAVSVAKVGEFSSRMHELNVGDYVGVRGPFGRGFELSGRRHLMVAGGYGAAPLAMLGEAALAKGHEVHWIVGAKRKDELLFVERMRKAGADVIPCTEDGSLGRKGFATDALEELLEKGAKADCIYTCGPELMMKKVLDIAERHGLECQASVERYMKCGFGVCGSCACDGRLVCMDGPVFRSAELKEMRDFGRFTRDAAGVRVPLGH